MPATNERLIKEAEQRNAGKLHRNQCAAWCKCQCHSGGCECAPPVIR